MLPKERAEITFTALAFFACDLLGNTDLEIKEKFPRSKILSGFQSDHTQCIELRKSNSIALCFLSRGFCSRCFLFLDDEIPLDMCRNICDEICEPNGENQWKAGNIHIQLTGQGENSCFYFYLQ